MAKAEGLSYNADVSKPSTDPTKEGYTFFGWYTEKNCVNRWDFVNGKVTDNMTLYAKWVKNTFSISGIVKEKDGSNIDGVEVKLMQGNAEIGKDTTENDGTYSFSGVAPDSYNVVATKADQTVTILVEITDAHATDQDLEMPTDKVNSVLVVKSSSNITTPDVVVGELDEEAEAVKTAETGATSVTVRAIFPIRSSSSSPPPILRDPQPACKPPSVSIRGNFWLPPAFWGEFLGENGDGALCFHCTGRRRPCQRRRFFMVKLGIQLLVCGQYRNAEPFAEQGIGNELRGYAIVPVV